MIAVRASDEPRRDLNAGQADALQESRDARFRTESSTLRIVGSEDDIEQTRRGLRRGRLRAGEDVDDLPVALTVTLVDRHPPREGRAPAPGTCARVLAGEAMLDGALQLRGGIRAAFPRSEEDQNADNEDNDEDAHVSSAR
jgi:hypothetical protein